MIDPLTEVISLLQPGTVFSKGITGAGKWAVRYSKFGHPSFCAVLEGSCRLRVDGSEPLALQAGDFVLMPATPAFTLSGFEPARPKEVDPTASSSRTGELRHGTPGGPPDVRLLGGYFVFGSPDAPLIVSLLPRLVHVRGERRLATLVALIGEESRGQRPGRELVLARLAEILLIESLRSTTGGAASPGLLRGLADTRLAVAIRRMHAKPEHPWTVERLAAEASLSRSAFFDRFTRAVGVPPMEYLTGWRMALAKEMLRTSDCGVDQVAERVGYSSASTFSTAFSRHIGEPPARYGRARRARLAPAVG